MIALGIVFATGLYFVGLGLTSIFAPERAAKFLLAFAGSPTVHYLELSIRLIVGWALWTRAAHMSFSGTWTLFGGVLVLTTLGLLLTPWSWHHRFAQAAVPAALRYLGLIGIASVALGVVLIGAALRFWA